MYGCMHLITLVFNGVSAAVVELPADPFLTPDLLFFLFVVVCRLQTEKKEGAPAAPKA